MSTKRDYYEVLEVSRTASDGEISAAYRKLAIKYHPDRNPDDDEAIERFKECAQAFEVLSDSDKRARYDRHGHAGVEGPGGGAAQFTDINDIFEAFGGIFGDLFGGEGRAGGRRVRRGSDVQCQVTLDLVEAARGVNHKVRFARHARCEQCEGSGAAPGSSPVTCDYCGGAGQVLRASGILRLQTTCPSCHGEGKITKDPCRGCRGQGYVPREVTREVQIPAGIDDGMRVRLPGEGEPSPNGGPPGDCYCFIHVKDHPLFERDGQHLILRMPITYSQAALGATLEIPTLNGPANLTVHAGTQPGEVFTLRGKGLADPRRSGVGNLLVQVNIEVPKTFDAEQENLLRQLSELEHTAVTPHRKNFFEKVGDFFTTQHDEAPSGAGAED